jgi:4-hydroxybenzoate polyprenyltransferase
MLGCWFRAGRLHSLRENLQYNYLDILTHFAKNRTQVYMYVSPAIISMLIASNGKIEPFGIIAILAIYFVSLATYIYNDLFDIKIDKTNFTNRPLVSSKATRKDFLILATMLNLVSVALILTTNILATLSLIGFISLGILYSHPKTSLKDKFPFKTIAAGTGAILTSFTGSLAVGILPAYVIYVALASFASLFILGSLGDIGDLRGDKEAKRRTFPIVIGVRQTVAVMILIVLAITSGTFLVYDVLKMNLLGLFLIIGIATIAIMVLRSLGNSAERNSVMKTRYKMRTLHLLFQLSMLIGAMQIF